MNYLFAFQRTSALALAKSYRWLTHKAKHGRSNTNVQQIIPMSSNTKVRHCLAASQLENSLIKHSGTGPQRTLRKRSHSTTCWCGNLRSASIMVQHRFGPVSHVTLKECKQHSHDMLSLVTYLESRCD